MILSLAVTAVMFGCFISRSIGIFVHLGGPGRICLLRGADVGSENFALTPEFLRFFQQVAIHVVETEDGGHVDIFAPLLACGECFLFQI